MSRACHGARAMHHAGRFACLISAPAAPHAEAVAAVKCRSRHGKASRGGSRLVCIFYFSHRWPRRADAQRATLRCGGALARARQLLPPPARRAHARLHQEGHRQRALIRQGRPRTLCASDSAQASLSGVSRFDRSCRERVTAHGRLRRPDFWSGRTHAEAMDAVSAQLHMVSPRAGSTLVCTFYFSWSAAPRRRSARFSVCGGALSHARAAATATTRTPCARAPPPR